MEYSKVQDEMEDVDAIVHLGSIWRQILDQASVASWAGMCCQRKPWQVGPFAVSVIMKGLICCRKLFSFVFPTVNPIKYAYIKKLDFKDLLGPIKVSPADLRYQ